MEDAYDGETDGYVGFEKGWNARDQIAKVENEKLRAIMVECRRVLRLSIVNAPYVLAHVHGWRMPEEVAKEIHDMWKRFDEALSAGEKEQ